MQKHIDTVPATTLKKLGSWSWPGSIRELENFIERAVILTRGRVLDPPLRELSEPIATTIPSAEAEPLAREDVARIVKETVQTLKKPRQKTRKADRVQQAVRRLSACCAGQMDEFGTHPRHRSPFRNSST
jgi:transcriptional regulator with GAF, ATPase, and Fis domain